MIDFFIATMFEVMEHEGFRAKPYRDTEGVLTVGFGTNLEEGISYGDATSMMVNALEARMIDCQKLPVWGNLNAVRKGVLLNMAYNLGMNRLRGFERMFRALASGDYEQASKEMLDSKWATQVGERAKTLAERMRTGKK